MPNLPNISQLDLSPFSGAYSEAAVAEHDRALFVDTCHASTSSLVTDSMHKTPIGCTLVVYRRHLPIVSTSLFNISMLASKLKSFPGASSVSVPSLFHALQEHINTFPSVQRSIDPVILSLLQNSSHCSSVINHSEIIKTATCRIPEFSAEHLENNMQDPSFGFALLSQNGHPGDYPFLQDQQIFSIGSILQNNPLVQHFSAIWGPSGLQLDFHFLVLIIIEPAAGAPPLGITPPPSDPANMAMTGVQSQQNHITQWPANVSEFCFSHSVAPEMQGPQSFAYQQGSQIHTGSDSAALSASGISHTTALPPQRVQSIDYIAAVNSLTTAEEQSYQQGSQFRVSELVTPEIQTVASDSAALGSSGISHTAAPPQPVQSIDYIAAVQSLTTAEEQSSAMYVPSQKSFFLMARNWFCMWNVLHKFDLNGAWKNEDRKYREATILEHFRWAPTTYRNKTQLFEWAVYVSKLNWLGEKTGGSAEAKQHWQHWQGLVFLFKVGGAIEQNKLPRKTSVGAELWATQLSQAKAISIKRFLTANSSVLSSPDDLS